MFEKAEAELAYELQKAKLLQAIREEEVKIDVVERHKQVSQSPRLHIGRQPRPISPMFLDRD